MSNVRDKATELLGKIDAMAGIATKPAGARGNKTFMATALEEIKSDAEKEAVAELKKLVQQAISLAADIRKAEKTYNDTVGKLNKEMDKLMNRINAMAEGRELPVEEKAEESKPE